MEFKLTEEEVASMVAFAIQNGGAPFQMMDPVIEDMKFHSGQSRWAMTVEATPKAVLLLFGSSAEDLEEGEGEEGNE